MPLNRTNASGSVIGRRPNQGAFERNSLGLELLQGISEHRGGPDDGGTGTGELLEQGMVHDVAEIVVVLAVFVVEDVGMAGALRYLEDPGQR